MELLYGGGLRVSELDGLNYGKIDLDRGLRACSAKGTRSGCARSGGSRWLCW